MAATNRSVIVAGARTPVGRFQGSLKDFSGAQLGGIAIAGALAKAGVAPSAVDYVIMGQVLTAGAGQMPARQAAVAGGIGMDVPALTINKVCLSGVDAIALADQLIRAGEFEVVVAGGQESMTNAPHLLPKSRAGFKYGDVTLIDHMAFDGLHDAFTDQAMGLLTEQRNASDKFTREEQDEFAARSHQNAAADGRTAPSPTKWSRCRFRSARAIRSSSPRMRASGPTPRLPRWPDCVRRSARTGPSLPGRRRRSPMVPAPSS
ncbi:putative acetyl-CoA acetyltransferase [Mycobacteroides abscessus subsp. bolletii 1513]|uniref:Probable acetyl-CoA acetyltransferase n=1 Tax=Mycobacteroides abscessus subsp. bolletii 1513 TaxID=1299321 RepID=X8DSC6_9MYCO|nr:putative acetyl-CoA acetyltransferase [Mycobacteroides abscessus subsp. bolletii 1513]